MNMLRYLNAATPCVAAALALGTALGTGPAAALTGDDIMNKMTGDERFFYISGAVEMAAFLANVGGEKDRSICIMDWYLESDESTVRLHQALSHFSDRQAHPVIVAVINRACPQ